MLTSMNKNTDYLF